MLMQKLEGWGFDAQMHAGAYIAETLAIPLTGLNPASSCISGGGHYHRRLFIHP